MPRTTLEDVAQKAGVSSKTVSRVLNEEPNVSKKTAEKVKAAIAELNYVPNSAARSLSSGKAMSIGLVVGWPVNSPYSSTLIEQTLKECTRHGYSLALFSVEDRTFKQIMEAYLGRQMDSLILDTRAAQIDELTSWLDARNVPTIVIHPDQRNSTTRASFIRIDNRHGAWQAVNYLIQLGHRHIACISYDSSLTQEADRLNGYIQALAEAGLPFRPEWVSKRAGLPFQVGFAGAVDLLSAYPEITAFFAQTDEIAMGTLAAIWNLGLKVPDDVSVVGFDDISYASMIAPPLTTVHQPIDEIAAIAVQHLIEKIDNPAAEAVDLILPTRFVIRKSCKAPASAGRPTAN